MTVLNSKAVIEGLLFAVGEEGITTKELSRILEASMDDIARVICEMQIDWKTEGRGLQIIQLGGNFQITTLPEHSSYFTKLVHTAVRKKPSRAALETLAIIAYKQPITRLEIEEIRGVKSERILHILQRQGLITDTGRSAALGRPILYGTTEEFLNYFGLSQLDELPSAETIFEPQDQENSKQYLFQQLGIKMN